MLNSLFTHGAVRMLELLPLTSTVTVPAEVVQRPENVVDGVAT